MTLKVTIAVEVDLRGAPDSSSSVGSNKRRALLPFDIRLSSTGVIIDIDCLQLYSAASHGISQ